MTQQEAHIAGIGTAFPFPITLEHYLKVDTENRRFHGQSEETIQTMRSLVEGSQIRTHHTVNPGFLPEDESPDDYPDRKNLSLSEDILTPYNFSPPFWKRMTVFKEAIRKLGVQAARNAIEDWGGDPKDIGHIFTTCTSGWQEPGLPVTIMEELNVPYHCQKAELNFNGCFCGATCLRLGRHALVATDGRPVLVVAVEIPSLHYDAKTEDMDDLVTQAIFRDGAGAVVLASEGKWKYKKTGEAIVPNTAERMTFYPPQQADQTAYRMHLDKDVGGALADYLRNGYGTNILDALYPDPSKTPPELAIHPGGIRILEGIGGVLSERGWSGSALDTSYEILRAFGNTGAAAMLIVLDRKLKAMRKEKPAAGGAPRELATLACGPGVTVEWALLEEVA